MTKFAYLQLVANSVRSQSSVKNVFIRGSVVRYVHLPAAAVDTPLLEDATRRGTVTAAIALPYEYRLMSVRLQKPLKRQQRPSKDECVYHPVLNQSASEQTLSHLSIDHRDTRPRGCIEETNELSKPYGVGQAAPSRSSDGEKLCSVLLGSRNRTGHWRRST